MSPDGSAFINTGNLLKPGQRKIMLIADESAVPEGDQIRKETSLGLEADSSARMAKELDIPQRGDLQ